VLRKKGHRGAGLLHGFLIPVLVKVKKNQKKVRLTEIRLELQASLQPSLTGRRISKNRVDSAGANSGDWIPRIELGSPQQPAKRFVRSTEQPEGETDVGHRRRQVGIDFHGLALLSERLPIPRLDEIRQTERLMPFGQVRVELDRLAAHLKT